MERGEGLCRLDSAPQSRKTEGRLKDPTTMSPTNPTKTSMDKRRPRMTQTLISTCKTWSRTQKIQPPVLDHVLNSRPRSQANPRSLPRTNHGSLGSSPGSQPQPDHPLTLENQPRLSPAASEREVNRTMESDSLIVLTTKPPLRDLTPLPCDKMTPPQ